MATRTPPLERSISSTLRPQPWARAAAYGASLVTLPSAIWRILMILGLLPGTDDLQRL